MNKYTVSLVKELKYIEDVENKYLQNEINYSNFNPQEFDDVKTCKYCNYEFNHPYNNRCIILNEIVDKESYLLDIKLFM